VSIKKSIDTFYVYYKQILRQMDLKAREKTRKKSQRKLHKMYQMAMTNTAAANR